MTSKKTKNRPKTPTPASETSRANQRRKTLTRITIGMLVMALLVPMILPFM